MEILRSRTSALRRSKKFALLGLEPTQYNFRKNTAIE
jgi:hypothetical protein